MRISPEIQAKLSAEDQEKLQNARAKRAKFLALARQLEKDIARFGARPDLQKLKETAERRAEEALADLRIVIYELKLAYTD